MSKKLYIQKYCKIKNNQVFLNGEQIFEADNLDKKEFLKRVYNFIEIKYSKFFKMDNLSKLAFLSAEFILNEIETEGKNIGIVLSNNASSIETDRKHQDSINDKEHYYPSPAVFVYTLPNIGIGEISIRHQLKSENGFFVFENYNANFHYNYEKSLINNNKDSCEAFLYLISETGTLEHTEENLNQLYNN